MIENFKEHVIERLASAGLLANGDESIFSSEKMIRDVQEEHLMLVGPNGQSWVFLCATMPLKEFDTALDQFITLEKDTGVNALQTKISINPNISFAEYLECIAKLLGGSVSAKKASTLPLKDIISSASKTSGSERKIGA